MIFICKLIINNYLCKGYKTYKTQTKMDKPQEAFRTMLSVLLSTMNNNKKEWAGNELIKSTLEKVVKLNDEVSKNSDIQENVLKGWTTMKLNARIKLNESTYIMNGFLRSLAVSVDDKIMYENFKVSMRKLEREYDTLINVYAQHTFKTIEENKAELKKIGLTQEIIDDFETTINDYTKIMSKPGVAIARQCTATDNIAKDIKKLRQILREELDTYMIIYKLKSPDFYRLYKIIRRIHKNKVTHFSMRGVASDSITGKPIQFVKVKAVLRGDPKQTEIIRRTSKSGIYIFKKLKPGVYDITFELDQYQPQTIKAVVQKNKLTRVNVSLSAAPPNLPKGKE